VVTDPQTHRGDYNTLRPTFASAQCNYMLTANYNYCKRKSNYLKLNTTKLVTNCQCLYNNFFHNKMNNDYVAMKVIKMPL